MKGNANINQQILYDLAICIYIGMAIGDGLVDPINQLDYGDFLYSIGLVDANQAQFFHDGANQTAELIEQEDYLAAFQVRALLTDVLT